MGIHNIITFVMTVFIWYYMMWPSTILQYRFEHEAAIGCLMCKTDDKKGPGIPEPAPLSELKWLSIDRNGQKIAIRAAI